VIDAGGMKIVYQLSGVPFGDGDQQAAGGLRVEGDLDQALTYAQRAKQLLPQLNEISDTLGWIYLKKNLTDNAIETFSDIVTKQPQHSTYRYHLGMAYVQKGDKLKASQELQKALKSNPPKDERDKIEQLLQKLG